MQLGPNRAYIMVFVAAVALLALAVMMSKSDYFHNLSNRTVGETMPSAIERHYTVP